MHYVSVLWFGKCESTILHNNILVLPQLQTDTSIAWAADGRVTAALALPDTSAPHSSTLLPQILTAEPQVLFAEAPDSLSLDGAYFCRTDELLCRHRGMLVGWGLVGWEVGG